MLSMREAADVIQGLHSGNNPVFHEVSTDSRTIADNALYVALRGSRFDGHQFVDDAVKSGAVGVLVEIRSALQVAQIAVADTEQALGRLAAHWRRRFDIPVVAVTGSNGKTTVKEMIGRILNADAQALVSQGSFNNFVGLPLSLLKMRDSHDFAVVELGMNQVGEIQRLAEIARPTVSVITNAGAAHLEKLLSVDQVAAEKGRIIGALQADGIAVLNMDSSHYPIWREMAGSRRAVTFGRSAEADLSANYVVREFGSDVQFQTPHGSFDVNLRLAGEHNVVNALAAAAVGIALKLTHDTIKSGLEAMRPVARRLQLRTHIAGGRLIDDTYNANPSSVAAALKFISGLSGDRRLVMGDMFELGTSGQRFHREVGRLARASGIGRLYALGTLSAAAAAEFGRGATHYMDRKRLLRDLGTQLQETTTVLVKGSRGMRMDEIADSICPADRHPEGPVK